MAPDVDEIHAWCGYWLGPPSWFGTPRPQPIEISGLPPDTLAAYRRVLISGGDAIVTSDGVVLIDFRGLDIDPTPGKITDAPFGGDPRRGKASVLARRRVEVLNAHQACLLAAIGTRESAEDSWSPHPRPVDVRSLIRAQDADSVTVPIPVLRELIEFSKPPYSSTFQRSLFQVTPEQTDRSFDLFEQLISGPPIAISAARLLLHATHRYTLWEFDQSLVAAWTAAETLLAYLWAQHVEKLADTQRNDGSRLTNDRRRRLNGREYTASVIGEMLALNGTIDQTLYEQLNVARSARNRWVHGLTTVPVAAVESAIEAGEHLLQLVSDVEIQMPLALAESGL